METNTQRSGGPSHPPRRIGVGQIGTGLAARRLHWPVLARMPERFAVVAFSDRVRTAAEEYAALTGLSLDQYHEDYHDLLRRPDVEAVVVAVPIPRLLAVARDCLAAGKHVLCEKPPGASEAEAAEFAGVVAQHPQQRLLMGEQLFYRDEARLARSLLAAGAIGEPRLLLERVARHEVPRPGAFASTPWRSRPEYPGGSLLDGGIHHLATFRLLGGDLIALTARMEWLNQTIEAPSGLTFTAAFASGVSGQFTYVSTSVPVVDEANDTRLYGTEGNLVLGYGSLKLVHPDGGVDEYFFEGSSAYYNEFVNFYEAIVDGEPIVGNLEQSRRNMLVLLRAFDSATDGQPRHLGNAPWNQPTAGVPLWRPRGADGLFDGLPTRVTHQTSKVEPRLWSVAPTPR